MILLILTLQDRFRSVICCSLESSEFNAVPPLALIRRTTENSSILDNLCVNKTSFIEKREQEVQT